MHGKRKTIYEKVIPIYDNDKTLYNALFSAPTDEQRKKYSARHKNSLGNKYTRELSEAEEFENESYESTTEREELTGPHFGNIASSFAVAGIAAGAYIAGSQLLSDKKKPVYEITPEPTIEPNTGGEPKKEEYDDIRHTPKDPNAKKILEDDTRTENDNTKKTADETIASEEHGKVQSSGGYEILYVLGLGVVAIALLIEISK